MGASGASRKRSEMVDAAAEREAVVEQRQAAQSRIGLRSERQWQPSGVAGQLPPRGV